MCILDKLIQADPDNVKWKIDKLTALYDGRGSSEHELTDALAIAEKLKRDGNLPSTKADTLRRVRDALPPNVRGQVYYDLKDYDSAIAYYTEAIQLDPKYYLYMSRGSAFQAKRDFDHAIADFTEAIQLNPNYDAHNNRGIAFKAKGDFDRAIADFTKAIQLDPKNAFAYNARATSFRDKGDSDRAIADFTEVIQLDPKNVFAYNARATSFRDKGDYDRAIADLTEAIRLDPKYVFAYKNRAVAYLYRGSRQKVLADLAEWRVLDPKDAYVALWLDIANKRANQQSPLASMVLQIDMTEWPAPVIRLYLNQLSRADLLAAADDPDPYVKKGRVCEANFYAGEQALQQGEREEAAHLFGIAAGDCPKSLLAYWTANAALKALGENR